MAYSAYKRDKDFITDGEGSYLEFICDTEADIADLPTGPNEAQPYVAQYRNFPRPGSMAVVAETGDVYALSPGRLWCKVIEGDA